MVLVALLALLCCTRQSRAPNIDRCAPAIWPWPLPWLWPLTLTLTLKQCNSDVKMLFAFDPDQGEGHSYMSNIKVVGQTVPVWERWRADGRYQVHYFPASPSYAVDNYEHYLEFVESVQFVFAFSGCEMCLIFSIPSALYSQECPDITDCCFILGSSYNRINIIGKSLIQTTCISTFHLSLTLN